MMRLLVAGLGATALLVGSCSPNADHTSADRPLATRLADVPVSADRPLQPVGDPGTGDSAESLEPIGPAATAKVAVDASGPPVVLTDVRLGAHPGFDRVVFHLGGDGSAGYRVGYTDDPRSQASGESVPVPGDAALAVTLTNLLLPADAPPGLQPWEGPEQLRIAGTTTLQALVTDGLFEGRYTFLAGLEQRQSFAVARLDDPQRIVVDVLAREPVALGHRCTSPDGVSVSYPNGWSVNTGEVAPPCTRFAPQAFSLPRNSDLRVAAITITVESVPFERASEPPAGQKSRIPLTVDGREAVRIEQQTAEGLYPLGTPMTSYVVDLGVCEDAPRTLIVNTVGLPRFDYARNVEVLDEMVHTLRLSSDRQD